MSESRRRELTVWEIILIVEFIALLIGLAMPITPSKTGGDFSLADWFFDDPSYFQEVLVYFLLTNLVLGLLALTALAYTYLERRRQNGP
ncbi:MAG: hypothetical protein JSV41_07650 [Gemmatimonadota bacterium]|nr:MAG: hypothetical protein JSV41_07650 [Gemmatimonadota bacterium]